MEDDVTEVRLGIIQREDEVEGINGDHAQILRTLIYKSL